MAKASDDEQRRPVADVVAEAEEAIEQGVERAKQEVREVSERLQQRSSG